MIGKATILLAVLAAPGMALATCITSVTSGGASHLTYLHPYLPYSIPLEWKVTMVDNTVWATGGTVWGPGTLTVTNITRLSPLCYWIAFGAGDVANGQTLQDGGRWGGYESAANQANYLQPGTTTLMTAILNGIDKLPIGVYTIYFGDTPGEEVSGKGWWTNDANLGDPVPYDVSSPLIIEIALPEPATMLLLAGALPLLRRSRPV
jgi:hypothetical protein